MEKKFEINTDLYPENLVKDAIIAFKEYAKVEYSDGNLNIKGENTEEIDEIFNELMNYIIGLYNEQ